MEQAAALTMSDKTAPPTREATPAPKEPKEESATSTPTATTSATTSSSEAADATPTLSQRLYTGNFEEEVGQVMKGLGSFWGGFKAKSASTLTSIKSDLDKTVAQVQSDLKQLQDTKVEVVRKDAETWEAEQEEEKERARVRAEEEKARKAAEAEEKSKGKGKAKEEDETPGSVEGAQAAATALLTRLSSSTSQLQSTVQSSIASALAAAKANPALANTAQLRTQLADNLRLQTARENITLSVKQAEKMAEEYLKKGEGFLKEAERVGGNMVKDAEKWVEENVRVIPPQEGEYIPSTWDTGEWYSFSTVAPSGPGPAEGRSTPRASLSSAAMAGSRKEALLRRLREDKDLLMVDPGSGAETKERRDEFASWIADKWDAAKRAGREVEEGHVGAIRMALVPEHLTDEQFWQRYLFHKDMIEAADAKRKLLLEATQDTADDFSWDDDEDTETTAKGEATTPTMPQADPTAPSAPVSVPATATATAPETTAAAAAIPPAAKENVKESAATSPRDSEESYDVVSGQVSTAAATETDEDSDWE